MLFSDVTFCLSGYVVEEGSKVKAMLEKEGALFIEDLDHDVKRLTHLILFDAYGENVYKYCKLPVQLTSHIHLVSQHWVYDSIKANKKMPEISYLVTCDERERLKMQENPLGVAVLPATFFLGHSFYFHNYDELFSTKSSLIHIEKRNKLTSSTASNPIYDLIRRSGGIVYTALDDPPKSLSFIITPYNDDSFYNQIVPTFPSAKVRTIFWLADAVRASNLSMPADHPLYLPRPSKSTYPLENMVKILLRILFFINFVRSNRKYQLPDMLVSNAKGSRLSSSY